MKIAMSTFLSKWDEMSNRQREPFLDASLQASVREAKRFSGEDFFSGARRNEKSLYSAAFPKRNILKIDKPEIRVAYGGHDC